MPYIQVILVPSHDFSPDWAAPAGDPIAEQSVACQYGGELPIRAPIPDATWTTEPIGAWPAADATAEQAVARQVGGELVQQPIGAPGLVAEPDWSLFAGAPPPDTTDQESVARQYGGEAPILAPIPDATWATEPIGAWPAADATAEQAVAQQAGGELVQQPIGAPGLVAEPDWSLFAGAPPADTTDQESVARQYGGELPILSLGVLTGWGAPGDLDPPNNGLFGPADITAEISVAGQLGNGPLILAPIPDGTWITEPIGAWPAADAVAEYAAAVEFGNEPYFERGAGPGAIGEPPWFPTLPAVAANNPGFLALRDAPAAHLALSDLDVAAVAVADRLVGLLGRGE